MKIFGSIVAGAVFYLIVAGFTAAQVYPHMLAQQSELFAPGYAELSARTDADAAGAFWPIYWPVRLGREIAE